MRKIPINAALAHAFASTRDNLRFAFRVSWPWLVLTVPLNLWAQANFVPPAEPPAEVTAAEMQAAMASALISLVALLSVSSIAVNWHRYILRDEVPVGWQRLRLDGLVWRYFGNWIRGALITMLAIVPLAIIFGLIGGVSGGMSSGLMGTYLAIAALIAVPVSFRLFVKLPATAVGNTSFTFRDAWAATRGNSLQLLVIGLLLAGGIMGAAAITQSLIVAVGNNPVVFTLGVVVREAVQWVGTILSVTILTSLYGFFVEGREF